MKLKKINKTYALGQTKLVVLQKLDLEIGPGQLVVLLGPSGSGKTTLLNLIGGLDTPTSGQVMVAGQELQKLMAGQLTEFRRSQVGFIFQFFNLIPTLTALENVALVSQLVPGSNLSAQEMLQAVGLEDFKDSFPSQLSGGQQQRVAIARALAKDTPLILCDEPTGELDYETGIKVLSLLQKLKKDFNKTFIIVTHNAAIGQMADRVLHLRSGHITSDELNSKPLMADKLSW